MSRLALGVPDLTVKPLVPTPEQAAAESQRAVKRLTIAELNELGFDDIRERFHQTRRDDRPAWVKALDLLDAPRNFIAGTIAPSIEARKRAAGEVGAGGRGKVFVSDILQEMGVKNRVVRAVAGFVGDVAFDPLTYVGPAGWGLKVSNAAGQGVRIGLRGRRALTGGLLKKGAIREVAEGGIGNVSDLTARQLFEEAGKAMPAGLTGAQQAAYLSEKVLGKATQGRVGKALSKVGGDVRHRGGILADFDRFGIEGAEAAQAKAARAFVAKYGKGSAPGLKIGGPLATSTIAHIPFTEFGIHVPAFSADGRAAATALRIANSQGGDSPVTAASPTVRAVEAKVREIEAAVTARKAARSAPATPLSSPAPAVAPVDSGVAADTVEDVGRRQANLTSLFEKRAAKLDALFTQTPDALTELAERVRAEASRVDEDILGSETARVYQRLQRMVHSADPRAAAEAQAKIDEIESRLTREQVDRLYGIGDDNPTADDIRALARAGQEVAATTPEGLAAEVARILEKLPKSDEPSAGWSLSQRQAVYALSVAGQLAQSQGWDGRAISEAAVKIAAQKYADPEDAAQMLGRFLSPEDAPPAGAASEPIAALPGEVSPTPAAPAAGTAPSSSAPIVAGTASPQPTAPDIDALLDEVRGLVERQDALPATPETIGDLLALRRLVDEAEAAAKVAKAQGMDEVAEAHTLYANAVKGSVKQFGDAATEEWRGAVQRFLQTDDDVIGASVMAPVRTALGWFGDPGIAVDIANRIDRGVKATFGLPGGMVRKAQRHLRNTMTTGSREVFNATERRVRHQVTRALDEAGLGSRTAEDYAKGAAVTFAHMFAERNRQALAAGQDAVFYTTRFGTDEPAEWVSLIDKAHQDGFFSKTPAGTLSDKLRQIAAENLAALDELGSQEYTDQVLGRLMEGYVPSVATPGAQARIAQIRNQQIKAQGDAIPGGRAGMALEAFQKPRSTMQYRFQTPDGQWHRFWEKDRWTTTIDEATLAQVAKESPEDAKYIQETAEAIRTYDALAENPEFAAQFAPKATDPWELNEMAREGHFRLLLGGGDIPGDFMDTNIATAMAARSMAHERAVARRTWLEYVGQFGVSVDPAKLTGQVGADGKSVRLKDGSVARVYQDRRTGIWGVEQGGQRFRPLQQSVRDLKNNPLIDGIGDAKANLYHEDVAKSIEDVADLYEKEAPALIQFFDKATAAWKSVTLFHPSWTMSNLIGDGLNYVMGGARLQDMARNAAGVASILRHADEPEKLKGLTLNIRGVPVSGEQFINDLRANRLLGNNRAVEEGLQLINRKYMVPASALAATRGRGGVLAEVAPSSLKADFLQRLSHEAAAARASATGKMKAVGWVARDRMMRGFVAPWFRANEKVGDYMRALAYASFLEQGHDMAGAVERTVRAGFDYSDLARVERSVFRRFLPFYSFLRLNGAYQMKLLMERPIYAGSFPLLHNALEEALAGEASVPMHARPAWMRQQLALQVGSDPNERFALMLGGLLPLEQGLVGATALTGAATMDGGAIQSVMEYFASSLNPLVRVPLEQGAGREFFSDRTIGDPDTADLGRLEHLATQLRPVREVPKLARTFAEQGPAAGAARAVLGGRVQPMDDERIQSSRLREFKDEEEKLRRAVRRAEGRQDTAASLAARARLLRLYESMVQAGFEQDVPVWGREQLQKLRA